MAIAFFDPEGNLHIDNDFFDKHASEMGKMLLYYLILKARNSPYKTRSEIRGLLGISPTTEWRWRGQLKQKGYL